MDQQPMYTTRREFLGETFTLLSAAATLPVFLGHTAQVLADTGRGSKRGKDDSQKILVIVQLAGGNDGLNTVIPYEMDGYYRNRPRLAIPRDQVLALEQGVGLHPAATGLKSLFDDGLMAVVQGVGYPNPNRSHFTSMDIWHTADPDLRERDGWLGRYFDSQCRGNDPAPDPLLGVALMDESPLALQGEKFLPLAFENPDNLAWRGGEDDPLAAETFRKLNNISGDFPSMDKELADFLQRAALQAQLGADQIRSAVRGGSSRSALRGGGELKQGLAMVARMIRANLPTQIYYVSMGGFDTHTGQQNRHRQLMQQLADGMQAFLGQLKADKLLDRVLVLTFSEFGRRVQENSSGGTDHGEAAPLFLFGGKVNAGVHEPHPALDKLHRGDLAYGCDFRRVYATVLDEWLGTPTKKVLGRGFPRLRILQR